MLLIPKPVGQFSTCGYLGKARPVLPSVPSPQRTLKKVSSPGRCSGQWYYKDFRRRLGRPWYSLVSGQMLILVESPLSTSLISEGEVNDYTSWSRKHHHGEYALPTPHGHLSALESVFEQETSTTGPGEASNVRP